MNAITRGTFGSSQLILLARKKSKRQCSIKKYGFLLPVNGLSSVRLSRQYSSLQNLNTRRTPLLFVQKATPSTNRGFGMFIVRAVRGVLKIRYLVLGGAVGGGMSLQRTYDEWMEALKEFDWMKNALPSRDQFNSVRDAYLELREKVKIDPETFEIYEGKLQKLRGMFAERWERALEAAEKSSQESKDAKSGISMAAVPFANAATDDRRGASAERIQNLQNELMTVQLKYQKELEKLERENKTLRQQLLLRGDKVSSKKIKKSLIDMYSEVLDELSDYDSNYRAQDHLPRVVVVGDQSSGKTSVLEMIAQARIFPRGAGEMMTRAPVKVTLSEGPYHVAQFKDSAREFDLTKEADLADLRREVEVRMKNSVAGGKTVSDTVISMTVKGPGLQRMVLVDLPGIISTVTMDMADDTRESIRYMTQTYMSNPNAIILCIQDGSVDAERSNVTDLVSQMDPQGKRTIFVLTKVDLAEENLADPNRIKKILLGKLFPMKALGYFAVVTGRGKKDDSIQTIKDYEEKFFRNSKLFKDGGVSSTQVTTRNLSLAVSECFWKMVRETIEQQADAFKATRFNLETEWKNSFPRIRELSRDELFEKARGEILDEVVNLSQSTPQHWSDTLWNKLWSQVSGHVFENIYLAAAQTGDKAMFQTFVDIQLKRWADQQLPHKSVECAKDALRQEFRGFLEKAQKNKDHDSIFDQLKAAVVEEVMRRHKWEDKGAEVLRVVQLNALEDENIPDKTQWDSALKFFETSIKDKITGTESVLREMFGPGTRERWTYWKYLTPDQQKRCAVRVELEKLLQSNSSHPPMLTGDELTTIRKNLQISKVDVDTEYIRGTWFPVYRRHFLNQALAKMYDCRKMFYLYSQGHQTEVDCSDIVLFWKVQQLLRVTTNSLRQQVMKRESGRLERDVKDVLEDLSQDNEKKKALLTGKRVELAEELKKVRQIQEKIEEFIQALNKEK